MRTVQEIKSLKEYYVTELYGEVRNQQRIDKEYIDDIFPVKDVRKPHVPLRSGLGSRIVNAPAEQIVTSNPQVFINLRKGNKESVERLSRESNRWIDIIRKQNPNPFKESVKNPLSRGEVYIQIAHNERWVTKPLLDYKKNPKLGADGFKIFDRSGMPVLFLVPDPMVVYGSPKEDENGIPEDVIIYYLRTPADVIYHYPDWSNPKNAGREDDRNKRVEWLAYSDKGMFYFEADGVPVLKGEIQKNIYGVNPFVRKYSGFGTRSPEGNLEELIVSDIKMSRDLIRNDCVMRSNISSVFHLFSHRGVMVTSEGELNQDAFKEIEWGAYKVNVLDKLPPGTKIEPQEVTLPSAEIFAYYQSNLNEITQRNPFLMAGFPLGSSGRQQDMTATAAFARYDTVVENAEIEWGTAFDIAFRICRTIPTLWPLNEEDKDAEFDCKIELRAADPIEEDRKITMGNRLYNNGQGSISLKRFHNQYLGLTQAESQEEIVQLLADNASIYNPDWAEAMGMAAAEEAGMMEQIEKVRQRRMTAGKKPPTQSETQRLQGEVETERGAEEIDMSLAGKGGRRPPSGFERGG